jgi:hypothetical protein
VIETVRTALVADGRCRAYVDEGMEERDPVAPSPIISPDSRRTARAWLAISRQTKGAKTRSAMTLRKKVRAMWSASSRRPLPTTKLPARKRAANVNARMGERSGDGTRVVAVAQDSYACGGRRSGTHRADRVEDGAAGAQSFDSGLTHP